VLALNYEFSRYIFVDIPEVLSCFKKRLTGHPKFSQIVFIEGDCNEVIEEVRFASPADHLLLAFIDPTGLQIRFRTIRRLLQSRSVDLLMTLQFGMGIRLNLNQYIRDEGAKLTAFWGNAEWHKDAGEGGSASQVLDAEVRFLSVEPLLEDMGKLDLRGVHWMIVGGESGVGARPMKKEWVLPLRDQCKRSRVPFFFKQWGGVRKKKAGRRLEGRTYDEFPSRVRRPILSAADCASAASEIGARYYSGNVFPLSALDAQGRGTLAVKVA
jgi:hypothetical protein